jgi:hypothetical protein
MLFEPTKSYPRRLSMVNDVQDIQSSIESSDLCHVHDGCMQRGFAMMISRLLCDIAWSTEGCRSATLNADSVDAIPAS